VCEEEEEEEEDVHQSWVTPMMGEKGLVIERSQPK
jgi:hypothetical protein